MKACNGYQMHVNGSVLPFAPGDVVDIEGQQHLIHTVSITGHPQETTASQTFHLQPLALPLANRRTPPQWTSRSVWAYVVDNEHDPKQQGRMQVEFETEPLDAQVSHGRAWLHTLTPYGGGQGAGAERLLPGGHFPGGHTPRAHAYSGFLSLPEVGERVLVEFLGNWDSDAVVLGSVRHGGISPADSARDTKRWRTPSGNEIALTTEGEGAAAKDVVSLHARNHVVLQGVVDPSGESVSVQCGDSYIHLLNKGGSVRVEVISGGAMLLHAAGHLQIEGDSVQIRAKGGKVRFSDVVTSSTGKLTTPRKTLGKTNTGKGRGKQPASPARYHSVIATRKGGPHLFAAYQGADGKVQEVRTGGTAAWRYNNPGNMNPGSIADGAGAIGKAWVEPHHHGNTAVFPDEETGYDGARALLRSSLYNTKTMEQTVHKWVGVDLGQLPQYVQTVQRHSGVQPTDVVGDLTDQRLDSLAHAMSVAEGWKEGTTYTPANVTSAPQWVKDLFDKGKAP